MQLPWPRANISARRWSCSRHGCILSLRLLVYSPSVLFWVAESPSVFQRMMYVYICDQQDQPFDHFSKVVHHSTSRSQLACQRLQTWILFEADPCYIQLRCCCVCRQLQQQYHLENNRAVPSWGKEIFSDLCIIIRPSASEELANFVKYTIALTQAHLQLSKQTSQVQSNKYAAFCSVAICSGVSVCPFVCDAMEFVAIALSAQNNHSKDFPSAVCTLQLGDFRL